MIRMNTETYHWLVDEFCGICLKCFSVRHGQTEGDAENYPCENEECGANRVQGIENMLVCGRILIDDEVAEPYVRLRNRTTGVITERKIRI